MIEPDTTATELLAARTRLPYETIGQLTMELGKIHDQLAAEQGEDAYVSVSATWKGPDGKLVTLSVASTEPAEDDE